MASFLMIVVNINLISEDKKFYSCMETRYFGGAPIGEESLTYATKISIVSLVLIFLSHFSIALIFCQIVEISSFSIIFIIPMILQLVNLFYISKILGMQLRIISLDKYAIQSEQNSWLSWTQIKICKLNSSFYIHLLYYIDIAALIFASYINLIYFNKIYIFVLISSNLVP